MFRDRRYQEITGIVLILISCIIFLSLFSFQQQDYTLMKENSPVGNIIGPLGAWLSWLLRAAFGVASYLIAAIFALAGWSVIKKASVLPVLEKIFSLLFLSITMSAMAAVFGDATIHQGGGFIGFYINYFLSMFLGKVGAYLTIAILNLAGLILLGLFSLTSFLARAGDRDYIWGKFKALGGKLRTASGEEVPLNHIGEEGESRKKVKKKEPWITRETVRIFDGMEKGTKTSEVKYLEMSVPRAASDSSLSEAERKSLRESLKEYAAMHAGETGQGQGDSHFPPAEPFENDPFDRDDPFFDDDFSLDAHEKSAPVERGQEQKEAAFDTLMKEDDATGFDDITITSYADDMEPETPEKEKDIRRNRIFSIDADDERNKRTAENITPEDEERPSVKAEENKEKEVEDYARREKLVFMEIPMDCDYTVPTMFLNSSAPPDTESWKNEVKRNSQLLVNTLNEFSIESRVINVNRGPVITLYEMQIAPGIKVNRIVGLSDDIAMALAASRVRIVAPIPGKSAIGVEIPNRHRENVTLGDIIKSEDYLGRSGALKVALGKDILGKVITLDLKRLPHLLIAGATGSGKSVCVNTIISSLIYNYDPNYVRFIMVDPKMVELQLYNGLPHLLTPVITDPAMAPVVLKWVIFEMERRYRLLSTMNTRDIERYNEKIDVEDRGGERLPYIVTIIDELADLMMVASKEIEGYITRIAQKARAVGIHLVLATQRPSVDVITGIIKANIPARIAFQVAQKNDSRTIIDQNGAEKLLGAGDMLYQSPMSSYPIRIQGAYISEDETWKIVEHLESLGDPHYINIEESLFDAAEEERERNGGEEEDELFVEALKIVEETRKASASYLQRRLSIGYNRAARIIELMEDRGYVGPQQGSKPREVFI